MDPEEQVEIVVSIRHRDSDFRVIGTGTTKSCVMDSQDFDNFARKLVKDKPLVVTGQRFTKPKRRAYVADAVLDAAKAMITGQV